MAPAPSPHLTICDRGASLYLFRGVMAGLVAAMTGRGHNGSRP